MNTQRLELVVGEDLEVASDLLGVEASHPLPETELVRDLKALAALFGVDVEAL